MKQCCNWYTNKNLGLIILRIAVGLLIGLAGIGKLMNIELTIQAFSAMGLAGYWVWVAGIAEVVGGLGILLGLFSQIASALVFIVMVVAAFINFRLGMGLMGAMAAITIAASSAAIGLIGPGSWSLEKKLCKCDSCSTGCPTGKDSMNKESTCSTCSSKPCKCDSSESMM